jgi:type IV secretion system protein VirB5
MAVVDARAIGQLVQQVSFWRQQIEAMRRELDQLRATHAAITGARGMEAVLPVSDAMRNYLPPDAAGLEAAWRGAGRFGPRVDAEVRAQGILPAAQVASLASGERAWLEARRASGAGATVLAREALAAASARFGALRALQAAIPRATDAKGIQDLQGRIAVEQTMLANEQVKLGVLVELLRAEREQLALRERELALTRHGQFGTRWQPSLP